ncbi:MAG: ATP-binding cassette domain-containing protein [Clostridia bacterium]|nr:ATP-binding cassette domain-containing protein [Clostridia bacterium]MBP3651871.1 ATP-binding cassette domain-containing protein [Clostridia bacterium]
MAEPMIRVENLEKHFKVKGTLGKKGIVHAVNGVNLDIQKGETLGLVGESGCGKSTLGRTILKVHEPDAGRIFLDGEEITNLSRKQMQPYRRRMQMIFQDPYASLNPRFTVGELIAEPMKIYRMCDEKEQVERVQELLEIVGLKPDHIRRYPHEFSGGQRQRIGIARALALNPEFIVCDEPISALDVSIQAQIINLLERIQAERGISYLFIAHDLTMVRHISRQIGVMYMGSLVEVGDADEICEHPVHPYTQILMSAVPIPDPVTARLKKTNIAVGEVPSPIDMPKGCPFAPRCQYASWQCRNEKPPLQDIGGRQVACYYAD